MRSRSGFLDDAETKEAANRFAAALKEAGRELDRKAAARGVVTMNIAVHEPDVNGADSDAAFLQTGE